MSEEVSREKDRGSAEGRRGRAVSMYQCTYIFVHGGQVNIFTCIYAVNYSYDASTFAITLTIVSPWLKERFLKG